MHENDGINKLLIHEQFLYTCTRNTLSPSHIHSVTTGRMWALKAFLPFVRCGGPLWSCGCRVGLLWALILCVLSCLRRALAVLGVGPQLRRRGTLSLAYSAPSIKPPLSWETDAGTGAGDGRGRRMLQTVAMQAIKNSS